MFFNQKLAQVACLASMAMVTSSYAADFVELKEGDDPAALMQDYDFTVVSFYNSEDWAIEIDQLL